MDTALGKEILQRMGLSEPELEDLLYKYNQFLERLCPEQRRVFLYSQRSIHKAAESLGDDITAKELEEFLKLHAPWGAAICDACGEGNGKGGNGHNPTPRPPKVE